MSSLPERQPEHERPFTLEEWAYRMDMRPIHASLRSTADDLFEYGEKTSDKKALALYCKAQGNVNFKLKEYRLAIYCYTKALEIKLDDNQVNSVFYNNRASTHFHLKDFSSSMNDALEAIKLNPGNRKAALRAAECLVKLEKYQESIDFCQKSNFTDLLRSLMRKLQEEVKCVDQDFTEKEAIVKAVVERNIKYQGSLFKCSIPRFEGRYVRLDDRGQLIWTVELHYHYQDTIKDLAILNFNENTTFAQILESIKDEPTYDYGQRRHITGFKICFLGPRTHRYHSFDLTTRLRDILSDPNYVVIDSIPAFMIAPVDLIIKKPTLDGSMCYF